MRVEGIVLAQDRKARGGRMEGRMDGRREARKEEEGGRANNKPDNKVAAAAAAVAASANDDGQLVARYAAAVVSSRLGKVREGMPRGWKFARKV